MKVQTKLRKIATLAVMSGLLATSALAQNSEIEVGALGLISDYTSLNVANGPAAGNVGPGLGFSGGFVLGQMMSNRWGAAIPQRG